MYETILVAEDDEDDAYFIERAFRKTGAALKLHIVSSGDEVIEYLEGQGEYGDREAYPEPVLVLLDLKMPGRNGFEVLEWKRSKPDLRMPFVVLSSSAEERDMGRARELGISSYLIKPPTESLLMSCFKQYRLISGELG